MAAALIQIDIISPEKPLYSGEAASLVAPAHDGEIGILHGHAPMVAQLGVGEVRISKGVAGSDDRDYFAVSGGFIQTSDNKVIIITEEAKAPEDVDDSKVQAQLDELQRQLDGGVSAEERAKLNRQKAWFSALLRVAAHRRADPNSALAKSGLAMSGK